MLNSECFLIKIKVIYVALLKRDTNNIIKYCLCHLWNACELQSFPEYDRDTWGDWHS